MDHTLHSTSSSFVNNSGTSPFFDDNKKTFIWAFPSIFLLAIVMIFSMKLSIRQINRNLIYQYAWSWTINNDFSLEFSYWIDPLTSIMSMLITTVAILVLIYSDNYMSHDQGYLRFFAYMSFFNISMLGLVTSSNLIQVFIFLELVRMCSYLLIGFWFTRPIFANAYQKAFVTDHVGMQLLNLPQFPFHVWLPDAMEGPTPISVLTHAATMVAVEIFLIAQLLPLFIVIRYIMNGISFIGIITVLLGGTLALARKDINRSLAYSARSQLGYMMLALSIGSYRAALFHLITHAYSKALLFLGSESVIHSMEAIVGHSPDKKYGSYGRINKTCANYKNCFLIRTLSICGIPPLACFWSKDEILNASWLYSPIFAKITYFTAELTTFYMFQIYLLLKVICRIFFKNYSGKKSSPFYSISLWGKEGLKMMNIYKNFGSLTLLARNNKERASFFFS
ncbi:LOW QUALITY PROTEIN: hypothetical protein Cgig2_024584 [Carnegiea gigantea]|uniref:NAD(P)H-quinone oxidoreductase subunit 5, chloroplastic n=1 Tax=Carnegiea gigantea TaxID=171969 RepID=A0A9Q1KK22_9CARY|nr:LOW QUALITY PROTEIN: hypothetical protein Cgig2_024584 [Carnegiea gigantea]